MGVHSSEVDPSNIVQSKTITRDPDYIIVKGNLLKGFLGKEGTWFSLYAFSEGEFTPVPFQVDEYDPEGRLICPYGKERGVDSDKGLFDENDEVVFMASDSGGRVPRELWPSTWQVAREIEITDPLTLGKGWAYLAVIDGPPERSETDYIDYFPEQDKYVTIYNTGIYFRDGVHRADYNHTSVPPEAGGTGVDFSDRLKIRINIELKFPPVTLRFDEDDCEVDTVAYIDGPIRIVRRNQLYLHVPFMTIPFGGAHDVIVYRDTCDTPIKIAIPRGAPWFIKSLHLRLGTDLGPEGKGMQWYNFYNTEGVLADGLMSESEKNLESRLEEKNRHKYWQLHVGPQGALMRRGLYNPDLNLKGLITTTISYTDDEASPNPPEEYPGQLGRATLDIALTDFPSGEYTFIQQWYLPHHFYPFTVEKVQGYMNILNHPLEVSTKYGTQ